MNEVSYRDLKCPASVNHIISTIYSMISSTKGQFHQHCILYDLKMRALNYRERAASYAYSNHIQSTFCYEPALAKESL
jgi:hypothetical protein